MRRGSRDSISPPANQVAARRCWLDSRLSSSSTLGLRMPGPSTTPQASPGRLDLVQEGQPAVLAVRRRDAERLRRRAAVAVVAERDPLLPVRPGTFDDEQGVVERRIPLRPGKGERPGLARLAPAHEFDGFAAVRAPQFEGHQLGAPVGELEPGVARLDDDSLLRAGLDPLERRHRRRNGLGLRRWRRHGGGGLRLRPRSPVHGPDRRPLRRPFHRRRRRGDERRPEQENAERQQRRQKKSAVVHGPS